MNRLVCIATACLLGACDDSGDGHGGDADGGAHLVGASPFTSSESAEDTNGTTAGAVSTGYTLDADGAVFSGAFEASGPTPDCYRFETGTATDVDVQVFVAGIADEGSPQRVFLSLDAIADDGYSALTGNGYFDSAGVAVGKAYRVCLTPSGAGTAGQAYTVEIRKSP